MPSGPIGFFIPSQLNDLAVDVLVDGPSGGEVLTYDDGEGKWVNADPGTLVDIPAALDDLSDVAISGAAQGQVLYRNDTEWVNLAVGSSGQVLTSGGAGEDVSWTTPKKRSCTIVLLAGYTPEGTGADACEIPVPYSPADGTTSITWNVRRCTFRVSTAGGAPALEIEKSTAGNAAFSATDIDTLTIASGEYQVSTTGSFDSSTVASGDLLRVNVTTLGTAEGWTVTILLEES